MRNTNEVLKSVDTIAEAAHEVFNVRGMSLLELIELLDSCELELIDKYCDNKNDVKQINVKFSSIRKLLICSNDIAR